MGVKIAIKIIKTRMFGCNNKITFITIIWKKTFV